MNRAYRDARIFRAVSQVTKAYTFSPAGENEDGDLLIRVEKGPRSRSRYVVTVDPLWGRPASCTCPDASERLADIGDGALCKHAVAVLLSRDDLRHQLIDLLL